ncbi:RNA polymerase sigma factor [bacterium]|nr:RNA polymerase sigma factor [bacterium]
MNTTEMSDADLVLSVLSGNQADFKTLMERYQQKIFSYLYRFLYENRDAAEDVTQSTFIKVYKNLKTVDTGLPLQPWIFRIAHNEAANYLRTISRKKESRLDDRQWDHIASPENSPEIEKEENQAIINRALEKLKTKYREVIVLHYFEEKSYQEIAEILGTSTNSVGTLLRRGRLKLQDILKQFGITTLMIFAFLLRTPATHRT